jgi:hypothetical protein
MLYILKFSSIFILLFIYSISLFRFTNQSTVVSSEKDIPEHIRDEGKLSKLASSLGQATGVSKLTALA